MSLTVDDELNRWQKYAYGMCDKILLCWVVFLSNSYPGCNELIFNPVIHWWHMGPITKQLRNFLWSSAPIHYKISMLSYMFSYYGIAASSLLALLNYLLLGLALDVDGYYMHSFEIFLACTVVFPGAGNMAYTLLEYRLGQRDIFSGAIENFGYVPFLCVYLFFLLHVPCPDSSHQLVFLRRSQHAPFHGHFGPHVLLQYHLGCYGQG